MSQDSTPSSLTARWLQQLAAQKAAARNGFSVVQDAVQAVDRVLWVSCTLQQLQCLDTVAI